MCQLLHCTEVSKVVVWTNHIVLHRYVLVASLLCCFISHSLDKLDLISIDYRDALLLHCNAMSFIETYRKISYDTVAQ